MIILFFLLTVVQSSSASLQEIMIPEKVFDAIKKSYNVESSDVEPEMVDITIEFKSKLGQFKLPLGYTQEALDLAQYISKADESLEWKMTPSFELDSKKTSLYFIPRYKPFKSALGKTYGYPCGTIYKFSENVGELLGGDALNIMTNKRQYLSILGGDYLVLHLDGKKLKMSYFKVRDSRWTHEMCKLNY